MSAKYTEYLVPYKDKVQPGKCTTGKLTACTVRGASPTLYARKKLSGVFEKFPKVQLEKKKGGIPPQDAEHQNYLILDAITFIFGGRILAPRDVLAFYTLHALSHRQWPVYSNLQFSFP